MSVQAPSLFFIDTPARILADGDDSDGRLGLVEMLETPAGSMPPLHVHHAHDEGFYLIDGEVTLFTPDDQITLRPGDFYLAPRGVPHTYRIGDEPAHYLVTSTPAGFERFVADVAALDELDPARLAEVGAEHEIEILGPPGALP